MYSKIPVPVKLNDDDIAHAIMFLPLVGAFTGACVYAVRYVLSLLLAPLLVRAVSPVIVVLSVTGGFHVDGYMDTEDALKSYQNQERKLEIMKDPHVGSFAIIGLAVTGLLMMCAFAVIADGALPVMICACGVFAVSRSLAALTSLLLKKARPDGMLAMETEKKSSVFTVVVVVQLIGSLAVMASAHMAVTFIIAAVFAVFTWIYAKKTDREFGGVTGDTAGYFITAGETAALSVLALALLIGQTAGWFQ